VWAGNSYPLRLIIDFEPSGESPDQQQRAECTLHQNSLFTANSMSRIFLGRTFLRFQAPTLSSLYAVVSCGHRQTCHDGSLRNISPTAPAPNTSALPHQLDDRPQRPNFLSRTLYMLHQCNRQARSLGRKHELGACQQSRLSTGNTSPSHLASPHGPDPARGVSAAVPVLDTADDYDIHGCCPQPPMRRDRARGSPVWRRNPVVWPSRG